MGNNKRTRQQGGRRAQELFMGFPIYDLFEEKTIPVDLLHSPYSSFLLLLLALRKGFPVVVLPSSTLLSKLVFCKYKSRKDQLLFLIPILSPQFIIHLHFNSISHSFFHSAAAVLLLLLCSSSGSCLRALESGAAGVLSPPKGGKIICVPRD